MEEPTPRRRAQRTRAIRLGDSRRRRSPLAWVSSQATVESEVPSNAGLRADSGLASQVASQADPAESGLVLAPCLVVLTGAEGRNPTRVSALLDAGAVIVIASNTDAVRAWLPGALIGAGRPEVPHVVVRVSHLELDLTEQRARWLGKALHMSQHELRLLAVLGAEPGRVWTFEELTERAWGMSCYSEKSAIYSAVKRARKRLERAGVDIRIESVRGVGLVLTSA